MVISDWMAKRKGRANITGYCPKCNKPYFQVGNYKPEDICQCKKSK